MRAHLSLALLLGLSLAACLPPPLKDCTMYDCGSGTETTSTGDPTIPTTTSDDPGVQTVTGDDPPGTSEPDPTNTTTATTGDPVDPPAILGFDLDPNPITVNGLIAVSVTAQNADGVRMELDDGTEVELESREPDLFAGAIPIFSGLKNGKHDAILVPGKRRSWTASPRRPPTSSSCPPPATRSSGRPATSSAPAR
jgi:hypothetical protein